MSEVGMHQHIAKLLKPWDPVRVENTADRGHPDLDTTIGQIEYKWLRSWPKDNDLVVRVDKYTPQQRAWHARRCQAVGGRAWVLLSVSHGPAADWLLIWGMDAARHLGHLDKRGTMGLARLATRGPPNRGALVACLTT